MVMILPKRGNLVGNSQLGLIGIKVLIIGNNTSGSYHISISEVTIFWSIAKIGFFWFEECFRSQKFPCPVIFIFILLIYARHFLHIHFLVPRLCDTILLLLSCFRLHLCHIHTCDLNTIELRHNLVLLPCDTISLPPYNLLLRPHHIHT